MNGVKDPLTPHREAAYENLRKRIVEGQLAPGTRLTEVTLAHELGISRTPVREVLFRLEREGWVQSKPHCGFTVAPLSPREIRELYPILAALECLALKTAGPLAQAAAPELQKLNSALAECRGDPVKEIAADAAWHEALLRRCPNTRLREMVNGMRPLTFRYEYAFRQEVGQVEVSVEHHAEIARRISEGNYSEAAIILEDNWLFNLQWLLLRAGETL